MNHVKYPRTYHLPFSEGIASDDKIIKSLDDISRCEIVITEKMDGENTTMYHDYIHARSIDSRHHDSRNWVKQFHAQICHQIPEEFRICGENLYAKHSVEYSNLKSYFYGFSVWERYISLAWDDTLEWFDLIGITPVKELYRGVFDLDEIKKVINKLDTTKQEGVVIRSTGEIPYEKFDKLVCKWVRKNHVQTDIHWTNMRITPNKLCD